MKGNAFYPMLNINILIKYFTGLTLILVAAGIAYLSFSNPIEYIYKFTLLDHLYSIGFASCVFILSGWKIAILLRHVCNKKLYISDYYLLPISMNLWGLILPIKGGLLYSLYYLKKKYTIDYSDAFSISIFSYIILLIISGGIGILIAIHNTNLYLFYISLALVTSPILLYLLSKIDIGIKENTNNLISKIKQGWHKVSISMRSLLKNPRLYFALFNQTIFHLIIFSVWVYWIQLTLYNESNIVTSIVLSCSLQISNIIRMTPGNIGINEIIAGGSFMLSGQQPAEGILVALFIRFSTMIITLTIGIWHSWENIKFSHIQIFK